MVDTVSPSSHDSSWVRIGLLTSPSPPAVLPSPGTGVVLRSQDVTSIPAVDASSNHSPQLHLQTSTLAENSEEVACEEKATPIWQWLSSHPRVEAWNPLAHRRADHAEGRSGPSEAIRLAALPSTPQTASVAPLVRTVPVPKDSWSDEEAWTLANTAPNPYRQRDDSDVRCVGAVMSISRTSMPSPCQETASPAICSHSTQSPSGSTDLSLDEHKRLVHEAYKAVFYSPSGCYRNQGAPSEGCSNTKRPLAPASPSSSQKRCSESNNDSASPAAGGTQKGGKTKKRKILARDPGEASREFACLHSKNDPPRWHRCRGWSGRDVDNVVRVSLCTYKRTC